MYERLLAQRQIAYTTVMTMMQVLERKGHLVKQQDDKAHVYTPAEPQQKVIGTMVRDFVTRVFDGSAQPLLMHLLEDEQITEEDLKRLRKLVKKQGMPRS